MPAETKLLSSFQRRDSVDKLMFGWVQAFQRALPGVSVEKAIAIFVDHFNLKEEEFNQKSQRSRYQRMVKEFWDDQRSPS